VIEGLKQVAVLAGLLALIMSVRIVPSLLVRWLARTPRRLR
jgi:hypothetical protein